MSLLIHPNGNIIAEIFDNRVIFKDPFIERELRLGGIVIPYFRATDFGTRRVSFKSLDFPRAFKEVYCENLLKNGFFLKKYEQTT